MPLGGWLGVCWPRHAGALGVPIEVLLRVVLQAQALSELQQCHTCSVKESALLWHALPVHWQECSTCKASG